MGDFPCFLAQPVENGDDQTTVHLRECVVRAPLLFMKNKNPDLTEVIHDPAVHGGLNRCAID